MNIVTISQEQILLLITGNRTVMCFTETEGKPGTLIKNDGTTNKEYKFGLLTG